MTADAATRTAYNGLPGLQPTLPTDDYVSADAFDRELEAIWYRNWVYVCRESDLPEALHYRTARIGTQSIIILRDETGVLRAFHNTCRHRGSELCSANEGRLKARLLTCPYHAWSYSLRGDLVRVPSKSLPPGFDKADYPLYRIALSVWRGFVFVNLSETADSSVEASLDPQSGDLGNWPIETLVRGHVVEKTIACNWKIFWENYNECLHCPGVHKHLSQLVPIYGRGLMAREDDPEWQLRADNNAPEYAGGLRRGAETWSEDGLVHGPTFAGLTDAERKAGQTYATHLPSMFVVGHVDYVRMVSLRPLGPTQTHLTAEWLFPAEALGDRAAVENVVRFGARVLDEDAAICEVNQRGLRSRRHRHGVLMPEEYDLFRFHQWVREKTSPKS
ncbi:MAG: aromatic ring-hydroxylating dioxygenase subunit alpha [Rhizobiaceae bacterium]